MPKCAPAWANAMAALSATSFDQPSGALPARSGCGYQHSPNHGNNANATDNNNMQAIGPPVTASPPHILAPQVSAHGGTLIQHTIAYAFGPAHTNHHPNRGHSSNANG